MTARQIALAGAAAGLVAVVGYLLLRDPGGKSQPSAATTGPSAAARTDDDRRRPRLPGPPSAAATTPGSTSLGEGPALAETAPPTGVPHLRPEVQAKLGRPVQLDPNAAKVKPPVDATKLSATREAAFAALAKAPDDAAALREVVETSCRLGDAKTAMKYAARLDEKSRTAAQAICGESQIVIYTPSERWNAGNVKGGGGKIPQRPKPPAPQ
jgi:hypothetical protein